MSRKGPAKERTPLLILFNQGAISSMLEAAELTSSQPLTEANYNFLKRLAEVLVGIGIQLCGLHGKEPDVSKPVTFGMYLQALLALTRHPSLYINQTVASLWITLFKHDRLNTQPELIGIIEPWIPLVAQRFLKTPACAYDHMDFDSDEELTAFHQRLRSDWMEAVRHATILVPHVTFCYAQQWLFRLLDNQTPNHSEWEALQHFLDCVASKAKEAAGGSQLLERCLLYQTTDPLIFSELLSCFSALFVYVYQDPARLLKPVLDRIFLAVLFNEATQSKDTRSQTVRNVRRHACSLLVKLSLLHSNLLVQHFEYLKASVDRLCNIQDESQLSRNEVVTLNEALLIISNQFQDFQMQSNFIGEVIRPAAERWTNMSSAFNSTKEFLAFIGLDRPPVESFAEDVYGRNRSELLACTSVFLAVLKRCKTANDPLKGHPAAQHMAPLLFNSFRLARVLHQLWEPESRSLLSQAYTKAFDIMDSELFSTLSQGGVGTLQSSYQQQTHKQQTPLDRAQSFLFQIHHNIFVILGSFGETLGKHFYGQPGLAVAMAGTVCYGMEHIPDYRLRTVVRVFCRPIICACPSHYHQSVLQPFLTHLFPAMLQRLSWRWQHSMQQERERSPNDENQADLHEILNDVLIRLLTRDYLDVLRCILLSTTTNQVDENEEMIDQDVPTSGQHAASVSELGKSILVDPSSCGHVLQCLLSALWWPDSNNSLKATNILESIVKYWAALLPRNSSHFPNSEVAALCLSHLLNGLQLLGQHDANLASLIHLGVLMYDTFLPIYPSAMSELMMRNAGCSREDANQYQDKAASLAAASGNKPNQKMEKSKRELFRKMTSQVNLKS